MFLLEKVVTEETAAMIFGTFFWIRGRESEKRGGSDQTDTTVQYNHCINQGWSMTTIEPRIRQSQQESDFHP